MKQKFKAQTGLERDELAGRRCKQKTLAKQNRFGLVLRRAGPPGLAVLVRDLDSDRRGEVETEHFYYYVTSPNPWLTVAGSSNDLVLREPGLRFY